MALQVKNHLQEPLHYPDKHVRFSFSKCDVQRYCITTLQRNEIKRLYATLGHLEKMTWGVLAKMPREEGLSIEKKDGLAYDLLATRMPECKLFGHFRVDGTNLPTRVFIGVKEDLAFILLIDRKGKFQHH